MATSPLAAPRQCKLSPSLKANRQRAASLSSTTGRTVRELTSQGERAVADLYSARYGVSAAAVRAMLEAVRLGNGLHGAVLPLELGGRRALDGGRHDDGRRRHPTTACRAKVNGLASENCRACWPPRWCTPAPGPVTAAGPGPVHQAHPGSWWPGELGQPGASGSQGNSRYAVFPQARRLAVQSGDGPVRVYDTLGHVIGGVQQRRGGLPGRLSFGSQHGTFASSAYRWRLAAPPGPARAPPRCRGPAPAPPPPAAPPDRASRAGADADAVLAALERLGELHQRGILTDEEFAAKKAELPLH